MPAIRHYNKRNTVGRRRLAKKPSAFCQKVAAQLKSVECPQQRHSILQALGVNTPFTTSAQPLELARVVEQHLQVQTRRRRRSTTRTTSHSGPPTTATPSTQTVVSDTEQDDAVVEEEEERIEWTISPWDAFLARLHLTIVATTDAPQNNSYVVYRLSSTLQQLLHHSKAKVVHELERYGWGSSVQVQCLYSNRTVWMTVQEEGDNKGHIVAYQPETMHLAVATTKRATNNLTCYLVTALEHVLCAKTVSVNRKAPSPLPDIAGPRALPVLDSANRLHRQEAVGRQLDAAVSNNAVHEMNTVQTNSLLTHFQHDPEPSCCFGSTVPLRTRVQWHCHETDDDTMVCAVTLRGHHVLEGLKRLQLLGLLVDEPPRHVTTVAQYERPVKVVVGETGGLGASGEQPAV